MQVILNLKNSIRASCTSLGHWPTSGSRWKTSRQPLRFVARAEYYSRKQLEKMGKKKIVDELRKHNLDTVGTIPQLIDRMCDYSTEQKLNTSTPKEEKISTPGKQSGKTKEKDPLFGRSEKSLMRKTNAWLMAECEKRGLRTNGRKLVLVRRLREHILVKEGVSSETTQAKSDIQDEETLESALVDLVEDLAPGVIESLEKADLQELFCPLVPDIADISLLKAEMVSRIDTAYVEAKKTVTKMQSQKKKKDDKETNEDLETESMGEDASKDKGEISPQKDT